MLIKLFSTSAIDSSRNVHYLSSKVLKIDRKKKLSELCVGLRQYADKTVKVN